MHYVHQHDVLRLLSAVNHRQVLKTVVGPIGQYLTSQMEKLRTEEQDQITDTPGGVKRRENYGVVPFAHQAVYY